MMIVILYMSTMSRSCTNAESAYPYIRSSLGEAGADRLFDIQDAGKISPAPFVLRRQSLARLPCKGLRWMCQV